MRVIDADGLKDSFCLNCSTLKRYKRSVEECRANTDVYGNVCFKMRLIDKAPTLDYAPKQHWISVKDRLPEEEKEVLCYLGNALGKGIVVAFRKHGDWYFDGWKCPTVTHWMPLPQAPKEEAE